MIAELAIFILEHDGEEYLTELIEHISEDTKKESQRTDSETHTYENPDQPETSSSEYDAGENPQKPSQIAFVMEWIRTHKAISIMTSVLILVILGIIIAIPNLFPRNYYRAIKEVYGLPVGIGQAAEYLPTNNHSD